MSHKWIISLFTPSYGTVGACHGILDWFAGFHLHSSCLSQSINHIHLSLNLVRRRVDFQDFSGSQFRICFHMSKMSVSFLALKKRILAPTFKSGPIIAATSASVPSTEAWLPLVVMSKSHIWNSEVNSCWHKGNPILALKIKTCWMQKCMARYNTVQAPGLASNAIIITCMNILCLPLQILPYQAR